MIGVIGANGYIGKVIANKIPNCIKITRDNWIENTPFNYDILINAACPSARFKSENEPAWSFLENVEKTNTFINSFTYKKFVQISSISARSQLDTVYGRHKLAAESLLNPSKDLVIRLTATYDDSLTKGVIYDLIHNRPIYLHHNSSYSFAPLDWVVDQMVSKIYYSKGVREIGGKHQIFLSEICRELKIERDFRGEYLDRQVIIEPESLNHPGFDECIEFIRERIK